MYLGDYNFCSLLEFWGRSDVETAGKWNWLKDWNVLNIPLEALSSYSNRDSTGSERTSFAWYSAVLVDFALGSVTTCMCAYIFPAFSPCCIPGRQQLILELCAVAGGRFQSCHPPWKPAPAAAKLSRVEWEEARTQPIPLDRAGLPSTWATSALMLHHRACFDSGQEEWGGSLW